MLTCVRVRNKIKLLNPFKIKPMLYKLKKYKSVKHFVKLLSITPFIIGSLYPIVPKATKASLEFQWDRNANFKSLKWFQKDNRKSGRNKIYLFLRSTDRKTGLIKVNLKVPNSFISKIKPKKVSLCKAKIGGFTESSKCIKNIPIEIELDKKNRSINIFPESPIPTGKDTYAIVLKLTNPNRGGLYQFHSFGQSSGNVPVSYYLGSWTLKMQSL